MPTYTWTGLGSDDDWSNSANWIDDATNLPGVPVAGDTANIDDAPTIFADGGGATVANADFQDDSVNGFLTTVLTGTLNTTTELSVLGNFADDTLYTLQVDATGTLQAANPSNLSAAVNIDNNGTIYVNGGTFNETKGGVQVGDTDDGYLTIADDGVATFANTQNATLTLGDDATGSGTVEVTGAGSRLTINGSGVNDGYKGLGVLDVDDSGLVTVDDDLFLGSDDGAIGQVNVANNGAELTVTSFVAVGEAGMGAVNINAGGTADFGSLDIAVQQTSGDPSTLSPSYVSVEGQPVVLAALPLFGATPDQVTSDAAYLTVSGAITVGDAGYGELFVGQLGFASGGSLDIAAQSTSGAYAGAYPTGASSNTVGDPSFASVEDDGSLTIAGAIVVGDAGYGELSVSSGGTVSGASLVVANQSTSGAFAGSTAAGSTADAPIGNPSFVTVDDATLTIAGAATIGDDGYGALYIEASGSMSAASLIVANQTTSGAYGPDHTSNSADTGSLSSVDLDDGSLTIAGQAIVGDAGYGGVLVTDGGTFTVGSLDIAAQQSSGDTAVYDRSYVEVTGDDGMGHASTLAVTNDAVVGDNGYGALTDFDGATTTIGGNLFIASHSTSGSVANSAPDFVDVDGTGSSIAVTGSTTVGGAGYGELDATNDGAFSTSSLFMGNGVVSVDSLSLVTIGTGVATVTTGIDVENGGAVSGYGSITGAIENDGAITASSGVLQLDGAVAGVGTETIDAGATLAFVDAVTGTGEISFASAGPVATLDLDATAAPGNGGLFSATLANFGDNDALDLTALAYVSGASATVSGSTLTVDSGGVTENFTLSNPAAAYYAYASGVGTIVTDSPIAPCYVRGTRILTERGEVAVEDLRVGELAVVASGASRPVRWLGHRAVDVSRHPEPALVRPVRVSAHAFGKGSPRRDLWLSPGHNIAWEGALTPISGLINGRSVVQVEVERVEYWHVELDAHDVMLAEGLAAESYLDTGNRTAFSNGGAFVEAQPDFVARHWADTCLPLFLEGPPVVAAKARLIARLAEQGHVVNGQADAHVVVDGLRIEPIRLSETRLAFALPPEGREIALRSNVFVPAHTVAENSDPRELGLCLGQLQIDGARVALERDDNIGWRAEFKDGRFSHRWTRGATPLPAGARIVIVDLVGAGHYWSEAETRAAALRA